MNPYVSFSLAMCGVLALALACTAYMAIYFNRRSKADLEAALVPLAGVVDGTFDIDEATVSGKYRGHLAEAEVALMPGGMGRVFHTKIVDGAGGAGWSATISRTKDGTGPATIEQVPADVDLGDSIDNVIQKLVDDKSLAGLWFRVDYDPGSGIVRLTRPMRTRREFPSPEVFTTWLETTRELADANRALQESRDAGVAISV